MKPSLLRLTSALVLTLPVYIALAHISPLENWFISGAGWAAFEPLFRLCNAIGITGDGQILIAAMLLVSFAIALLIASIGTSLVRKVRPSILKN
nr:hypothetical protein HUO10_001515 [Paraburkholderia busanensis]